jgi:hypothetical protein
VPASATRATDRQGQAARCPRIAAAQELNTKNNETAVSLRVSRDMGRGKQSERQSSKYPLGDACGLTTGGGRLALGQAAASAPASSSGRTAGQ